jgi:hypothetical protein
MMMNHKYLVSDLCRVGDVEDGQPVCRRIIELGQDVGGDVILQD